MRLKVEGRRQMGVGLISESVDPCGSTVSAAATPRIRAGSIATNTTRHHRSDARC